MDAYGIAIGDIGSHGKARIKRYGRGYPIVTGLIEGFSKPTHHWDQVIGVIALPYPLSPEEVAVEQTAEGKRIFTENLQDTVGAMLTKITTLENDKILLGADLDAAMIKIAALEGRATELEKK